MEGLKQFSLQSFMDPAVPVIMHYTPDGLDLCCAASQALELASVGQGGAESFTAPAVWRSASPKDASYMDSLSSKESAQSAELHSR